MWTGAQDAMKSGLTNVGFLRCNIEFIQHFFAPNEVDELWITFPDPQMKKATKRLTSTFFLQRYAQLLKPNGLIHLKTDSPFLYTYTRAVLSENHFTPLADTDDLYAPSLQEAADLVNARALQTHYEHQWLSRGLTIKYLCWALTPKETLIEPEIDIEKDTYRSYGRNYVAQEQPSK